MSPHTGDTQCLRVAPAHQWLHATTGRITTCAHSWMQAVHWVQGSGLYTPSSTHSPKFGPTTIAVAQEIAALTECRPSVDYLARKLKSCARTIKYHLGMLREAGLLVYRSKGTRVRGEGNQASVYERTIPTAFDAALGIRTTGEGVQRRPVGAAQEHRKTLGKLARKAARKVRRPRRRTPLSGRSRCTPMQVGTSGTSSAAGTHSPPESKLASGEAKSPTPKKSKRGPRKLNKVGTRYATAAELITTVPWLHRANRDRIAWVIGKFTDNGWTAREIQAAAELTPLPARGVTRPSGMLASRLASKHLVFNTPDKRAHLVAMWEDSRHAEQERHQEQEIPQQGPARQSVRRLMTEAVRHVRDIAFGAAPAADETPEDPASEPLELEGLTREEIVDMRVLALKNPGVIFLAIEMRGEEYARRLYSNRLVDQTLALETINARNLAPAF